MLPQPQNQNQMPSTAHCPPAAGTWCSHIRRLTLPPTTEPWTSTEPSDTTLDPVDREGWTPQLNEGRLYASRFNPACPEYDVRQSKRFLSQQRALDWLTGAAKIAFEEARDEIFGRWGLTAAHKGTCLLLPVDWSQADPIKLMAHFTGFDYPIHRSRSVFAYNDHIASFIRAAVWFGQWPRRGVDLDMFLSCGP